MKISFKTVKGIFLVIILLTSITYGQVIYFCTGVDNNENPIHPSNDFWIGNNGGYIYILLKLPQFCNTHKVYITIDSLDQTLEPWKFFKGWADCDPSLKDIYFKITFYNAGRYSVYIDDERKEPIAHRWGSLYIHKN